MSASIISIDVNKHNVTYINRNGEVVNCHINRLKSKDWTISYTELLSLRKSSEEAYAHIVGVCKNVKLYARREYIKFEVLVKDLPSLIALVNDNSDLYELKYLEHGMSVTEHFPIEYIDGEFTNSVSCISSAPVELRPFDAMATVVVLSKDWTRKCNKFMPLLSKWDTADESECLKVLASLNAGKLYVPEIPKQSIHLGLDYGKKSSIHCQKLQNLYNIQCPVFYRRHVQINAPPVETCKDPYEAARVAMLKRFNDMDDPSHEELDDSETPAHIKAYRSIIMVSLEFWKLESLVLYVSLCEGLKIETSHNTVQCSINTKLRNAEYYNPYGDQYPNRLVSATIWAEDWLIDIDLSSFVLHWVESQGEEPAIYQ